MNILEAEKLAERIIREGFDKEDLFAQAIVTLWKELQRLREEEPIPSGFGYTVGQRVLLRFYTEWIPATVVKITSKRVTLVDDRFKMTRSVHPKSIRPLEDLPPTPPPTE